MSKWVSKLKSGLEWLGYAKLIVEILVAGGIGTAVRALLSKTAISPMWITPIWLLVSAAVLSLLILMGPKLSARRGQTQGPFIRGTHVLTAIGTGPDVHEATINGSALADFADAFNIVLICGVDDPEVDRYEQTRMAASAPFTIVSAPLMIRVNHSASMIEVRNAAIEKAKATFHASNPNVPPGTPLLVRIELSVWTELVLLPKGVPSAEIRRLSDVPRFGGKILSRELQEGRLKQIV